MSKLNEYGKKKKKAVNNDYHRLTNYIEVQFRPFQPKNAPDLYPKALYINNYNNN